MKRSERVRLFLGFAVSISLYVILIPWIIIRGEAPACPRRGARSFGLVPLISGALLYISSHIAQYRVKGGAVDFFGMALSPRTRKLLTRGPYAIVRNPMALGAYLAYCGLAVLSGSFRMLGALIVSVPAALFYFRRIEETRLLRDFGRQFRKYRQRTPMFFPFPRPPRD